MAGSAGSARISMVQKMRRKDDCNSLGQPPTANLGTQKARAHTHPNCCHRENDAMEARRMAGSAGAARMSMVQKMRRKDAHNYLGQPPRLHNLPEDRATRAGLGVARRDRLDHTYLFFQHTWSDPANTERHYRYSLRSRRARGQQLYSARCDFSTNRILRVYCLSLDMTGLHTIPLEHRQDILQQPLGRHLVFHFRGRVRRDC